MSKYFENFIVHRKLLFSLIIDDKKLQFLSLNICYALLFELGIPTKKQQNKLI